MPAIRPKTAHRRRGRFTTGLIGLSVICVLLIGVSALSNLLLPAHLPETGRLTNLDKARLSEAVHMRQELGETLWPGWGQANIPMIVYNESYAFLVGYPNPPDGWVKVPGSTIRGGPWEAVPDDTFEGQTYYRQRLPNPDVTPEAFTVQVGNRWVSSMATREWVEIGLGNDFQQSLPAVVQSIFPYRLASRVFLSLSGARDWYIVATLHESFHAFQGMSDPARLAAAETVFRENQSRYLWDDENFRQSWQKELSLLAIAVQARTDSDALNLARQFLDLRQQRREAAHMDANLITLEAQKEWEEGLAKYTELALWRMASDSTQYQPLPVMSSEPDFKNYTDADPIWAKEVEQIRLMANDRGDRRFYYSGMAQAVLLDRLAPGWRNQILTNDVYLEDLLRQAVQETE